MKGNICWVRPLPDNLSSTIIELPQDETAHIGEVLKVGPGRKMQGKVSPTTVKVGERVLFHSSIGESFHFNGEQLLAMREPDIMAVIE